MAKFRGAIVVDIEKGRGCDLCVVACPFDVLDLSKDANNKGYNFSFMKNPESCTGCTACAEVCPDACITVYKIKV